jgi:hypothetical protein
MNEKLQSLITQLNSSQVVSLPEFIHALEEESLLSLSSVFSGTLLPGSSINWKNITDEAGEIKNQELFLIYQGKSDKHQRVSTERSGVNGS